MAYILNLETATINCSVCLAKEGNIVSLLEDNSPGYSHSENLHLFIENCLQEAGIGVGDLAAVAVGKGPGSFTGLRIGVSTAKGLCYALQIPLISTLSLKLMALQMQIKEGFLIPMLDARRKEVYTAVYDPSMNELKSTWAEILNSDSYSDLSSDSPLYFLGDGAVKAKEIMAFPNAIYHPEILPSAREMAGLSWDKFTNKEFEDTAYFEPYYLKDFIGLRK